jgi:hypothetical protein
VEKKWRFLGCSLKGSSGTNLNVQLKSHIVCILELGCTTNQQFLEKNILFVLNNIGFFVWSGSMYRTPSSGL